MTANDGDGFEELLEHLKESRGFNFTGYKRSSLRRRIGKRMADASIENWLDYKDYLEVHADEFAALFDTILINVTGFYRDPDAWETLATVALPRMLEAKSEKAPIRVW